MSEPTDTTPSNVTAEADAALDHALRERDVAEEDDMDYDDDPVDRADETDAEDYVLYSEVKPHLEALVALQAERETLLEERDKMIKLLLYARDRVSSAAVATRMDENLGLLGVTVIAPQPGDPFDPTQHEASATVPTEDAASHGTIAEVELAGYADGDRVVRHPIVTVYSTDPEQR